ncbi:MAG TPA: hypothetical protein VFI59_12615 [Actinomycetota bacterium]|nr:hypothetical protein [Actinomycetota bacterium]
MRRLVFPVWLVAVLALVACDGPQREPNSTGSPPPSSSPAASAPASTSREPSPSVAPSPSSAAIPAGVPATYDEDVPGRELPLEELVPPGDEVTGVDRARTADGDAVVIVFATPGPDPFSQARGFVVWRREAGGDPPWRAVYGLVHGKRDVVLAISVDTTDLTADASADALIREETGGTGACATYRVIDLAFGVPLWKRSVCDTEIQPNPDPIGLYEVARIYGPDDPHCCPSAIRERVLAWNGDRFAVVSTETTAI